MLKKKLIYNSIPKLTNPRQLHWFCCKMYKVLVPAQMREVKKRPHFQIKNNLSGQGQLETENIKGRRNLARGNVQKLSRQHVERKGAQPVWPEHLPGQDRWSALGKPAELTPEAGAHLAITPSKKIGKSWSLGASCKWTTAAFENHSTLFKDVAN